MVDLMLELYADPTSNLRETYDSTLFHNYLARHIWPAYLFILEFQP